MNKKTIWPGYYRTYVVFPRYCKDVRPLFHMNKRPFLHERAWSGGLNLWSIDFEVELIDFNTK